MQHMETMEMREIRGAEYAHVNPRLENFNEGLHLHACK